MKHMTSHQADASEFACPMHPEVKGQEGDRCPKCGMKLEKVEAHVRVSMSFQSLPELIAAGKPAHLVFTPVDTMDSTREVMLDETHEKKLHVIAVSEDLSWFDHIHADSSHNGSYTVPETFPHGGAYFLYADYKPQGQQHQTDKFKVNVSGPQGEVVHHHQKTNSLTDGYTVSVKNAEKLKTGSIEIPILVEKNGRKLQQSDFEKYLGAVAHIILVSQDEKAFMHIHSESTDEYPIQGHADISKAGIYRMWVQFQTKGTVHTADFTLNIKEAEVIVDQHSRQPDHKH